MRALDVRVVAFMSAVAVDPTSSIMLSQSMTTELSNVVEEEEEEEDEE